jgi:AraC-like DNA-binding protein
MIVRARAKRIRDFGCGELLTIGSGGSASLHYYQRDESHPHGNVEHAYPSHSLVFTDVGEWQYHGREPNATVNPQQIVAGMGLRSYVCSHPHNIPNECFIVAISNDGFEDEGDRLFPTSLLRVTPEMLLHRRALESTVDDPERLESLAFSLYDAVARASAAKSFSPGADVRMSYAKRLIRERCTRPATIAAIARELHMSRFTFTRRFLAHAGTTPHAYMTAIRIAQARAQLERTTLPIDEVAAANGFGSIAHFSSAFRRIVGCAPTAYRKLSS